MRQFAFVASALVSGIVSFALLLAEAIVLPLTLITPVLVPALVGFRAAVGGAARGEARLAEALLGVEVPQNRLSSGGRGYWGRAQAVVSDKLFWRENAYLFLRTFLGWPLAVAVVALFGSGLWLFGLPISYRWVDEDVGHWHVDTLQKAVLCCACRSV